MASNQFDTVVLGGTTYLIPKAGTNPPWGTELNDYLKALAGAVGTVVTPGDIPVTTAVALNNQVTPISVSGLSFDSTIVKAAFIDYEIFRSTSGVTKKEAGTLTLVYDSTAAPGMKWTLSRLANGDAGVVIDVTDAGQLTYTTDNMSGTGYAGQISFKAAVLI